MPGLWLGQPRDLTKSDLIGRNTLDGLNLKSADGASIWRFDGEAVKITWRSRGDRLLGTSQGRTAAAAGEYMNCQFKPHDADARTDKELFVPN